MSNSVYAEQINSAQIQGQAAARERAIRARQEAIKDEQAQIEGLEESSKPDVQDRERQKQQASDQEPENRSEDGADDRSGEFEYEEEGVLRHIDLTV